MQKRSVLIVGVLVSNIFATFVYARVVSNETTYPIYMAGYHADSSATIKTGIITIEPGTTANIDVPSTSFFSTKKRYIVASNTSSDLASTLSLPDLKALPHKDLGSIASKVTKLTSAIDFYIVDKDGRIKMLNDMERSELATIGKEVGSTIKKEVIALVIDKENLNAVKNNPHRTQVAHVRAGNALSPEEHTYLTQREPKVKSSLEAFLGTSLAGKKVPKIAIVLSGGGDRAMFASCGYVQGAQDIGLLNAVTYISSLSGSTWFLGSWFASGIYDINQFKEAFKNKMQRGLARITKSELSLMIDALKVKIAYHEPITMMDLLGALLGNALLSDFGPNRHMTYMSDQARLLANGDWPFPIYAALDGSKQTHQVHHWYEFTPYEVGGAWLGHYIPTWAFGRKFSQGVSQTDDPESALGFLFGTFGSAFAVDVTRIWQEILKASEKSSIMEPAVQKLILNQIGDKRITHAEEFNFTAGLNTSPLRDRSTISLIDAGFAFGLPYPAVSGERSGRAPDILIFMEASENVAKIKDDVEKGSSGLRSVAQYAKDKGLKFPAITKLTSKALTIYKNENDPTVPLVIWMPLVKDEDKWQSLGKNPQFANLADFEVSTCVKKSFCPSVNFTYQPEQAQQLISLGQFNMVTCAQEIKEAIQWKIDHMP